MESTRQHLQNILCRYATNTLSYINTVKRFSNGISKWILQRKTEIEVMWDIKERAKKKKTFADLEKELAAVLKGTLSGLQELDEFLDAVEKLAFTSLHVFTKNSNVLHLSTRISLDLVQAIITVAQLTCPLQMVIMVTIDDFFFPQLQNLDIILIQLSTDIIISQLICDEMEKSCSSDWCLIPTNETSVDLDVDLSEDDIQKMLTHIKQLHSIRLDQDFRIAFMLQDDPSLVFIKEFNKRRDQMFEYLDKMEENSNQLNKMYLGSRISSIAGSSVGAAGSVLTIVGLALIPVTAGLSLGLTIGGISLGVTSGVSNLVTTLTEVGVNKNERKKASETFDNFREDVEVLYECLDKAALNKMSQQDLAAVIDKLSFLPSPEVEPPLDTHAAFTSTEFKAEYLIKSTGQLMVMVGRGASKLAWEIPDIGQAVVRGAAASARVARAGLIAANAVFICVDMFFIVKDGVSLAKDSKSEVAEFLRARATLWRSQMKSWEELCTSQKEGQKRLKKHQAVLKMPFYPGCHSDDEKSPDPF